MKKSNFALRLQPALLEGVRKLAKAEGVAVNQVDQRRGRRSGAGEVRKRGPRMASRHRSRRAPRRRQRFARTG